MKRLLFAAIAFALTACSSNPPVPQGAAVLIKQGHFHTRYCGHYRFGQQWFFIQQHRHGVNCDHDLLGGAWVLLEE